MDASEAKLSGMLQDLTASLHKMELEAAAANAQVSNGMEQHHKGLEVLLGVLKRIQEDVARIMHGHQTKRNVVQSIPAMDGSPLPVRQGGTMIHSPTASAQKRFGRDAVMHSTMVEEEDGPHIQILPSPTDVEEIPSSDDDGLSVEFSTSRRVRRTITQDQDLGLD